MTEPELKPCPFCGGAAYNDAATTHKMGGRTGHDWAIACQRCEASAPGSNKLSGAVHNWNTRAAIAKTENGK